MKITREVVTTTNVEVEVCDGCQKDPTGSTTMGWARLFQSNRTVDEDRIPEQLFCPDCVKGTNGRVRLTLVAGDEKTAAERLEHATRALKERGQEAVAAVREP